MLDRDYLTQATELRRLAREQINTDTVGAYQKLDEANHLVKADIGENGLTIKGTVYYNPITPKILPAT